MQQKTELQLFYNLISVLYKREPIFYDDNVQANEHEVFLLFSKLREEAIRLQISEVKYLANIRLYYDQTSESEERQYILYHLLRGGCGKMTGRNRECSLPSFLDFVSLKPRAKCLSVFMAPRPILLALFGKEPVVESVLNYRKDIQERAKKEKLDFKRIQQEFKKQFLGEIQEGIDPQFIDFSVSPT